MMGQCASKLGYGLAMLLAGCGASLQGQHFHKPEVDYRIGQLSDAWRRQHVRDMDLAFHSAGAGTIGVHATCERYEDVPASALLGHLLFGTTQRTYLDDEEVTLDGRGARHARIDAELDGVPVRLEIYLLVHAPCVFDLSYVSDRSARGRAEFLRFVSEFEVQAVRGG
ncbi:MAG TPA: hypothetical protein VI299_19245 [Polyangiales bacterium]